MTFYDSNSKVTKTGTHTHTHTHARTSRKAIPSAHHPTYFFENGFTFLIKLSLLFHALLKRPGFFSLPMVTTGIFT